MIIQSFFETLHDFKGCIWWILGLIALVLCNGGILYTLSEAHYRLLVIIMWVMIISLDSATALAIIGFTFNLSSIIVFGILMMIPFLMAIEWLILYFVIRFNGYAFNFNYMHYNLTYLQWIAVWINLFVFEYIIRSCVSEESDDSDSSSKSKSNSDSHTSDNQDAPDAVHIDPTEVNNSDI